MSKKRQVERQTTMQELAVNHPTFMDISNGSSSDSLSTADDSMEDGPFLVGVDCAATETEHAPEPERQLPKHELDVVKYLAKREMTPFQERMNAITILPNPIYCLYFILAGHWVPSQQLFVDDSLAPIDESLCLHWNWFPNFTALPPPTVCAVCLGIVMHAPFSFLYHYTFAHKLDSVKRVLHWSRRMDHSAIHACSTMLAYATSGSWKYAMVNLLFNADCIYRQFLPKIRPRQNQIRVFISMLAYTIPILNRGDFTLFAQCWLVLFLSGYFFIAYPLQGWSHAVFHLVICFVPPLLMQAALTLPSSQPYVQTAIHCSRIVNGGENI